VTSYGHQQDAGRSEGRNDPLHAAQPLTEQESREQDSHAVGTFGRNTRI
jgi:hypothetical protein